MITVSHSFTHGPYYVSLFSLKSYGRSNPPNGFKFRRLFSCSTIHSTEIYKVEEITNHKLSFPNDIDTVQLLSRLLSDSKQLTTQLFYHPHPENVRILCV